GPVIPAGSLLARWQASGSAEEKTKLADDLQQLLTSGTPKDSPDAALYRQLTSLGGPLFNNQIRSSRRQEALTETRNPKPETRNNQSLLTSAATDMFGLD